MVELLIALASASSIVARELPNIVAELRRTNRMTDAEVARALAQHDALMQSHAAMTDAELDGTQSALSPAPATGESKQ